MTMTSIPASRSPRILICRLSAIGDCVLTMPVAVALRKYYPQAWISWLTQSAGASLLKDHAAIDEVITVPKGWIKSPRAVWRLRRQLQAARYDWAVDPQSLTKSSLAARISGASRRVGFAAAQGRELAPWLNNELVSRTADHVAEAFLQLLQPLGIENPPVDFQMPVNPAADQAMQGYLETQVGTGRFAMLNPGAGWDSRLWPLERYAQVASFLGGSEGVPSLVAWAGERERNWAEQIVAESKGHAVLAPDTSLPELVALTRRASLFVSSDTGPMHIAAAVDVPCVSLHGTTRAEHSGPYGKQHIRLQAYYQAGTSRYRRGASNEAMQAIPVEWVCQSVREILSRSSQSTNPADAA